MSPVFREVDPNTCATETHYSVLADLGEISIQFIIARLVFTEALACNDDKAEFLRRKVQVIGACTVAYERAKKTLKVNDLHATIALIRTDF